MIDVGKKAPRFTLPASSGEKVALTKLAGEWVVLFFYPKDMTSGCTTEARDFRDALGAFEERGARVFGVSKDSLERHAKFVDKESLNFPLLSDEKGTVIEKYGAWGEKNNYGKKYMGIIRSTVIIDPKGRVAAHFPKVRVKGHVEKVLGALDELQGESA